jgi:hypothetical protein
MFNIWAGRALLFATVGAGTIWVIFTLEWRNEPRECYMDKKV